VSVGGPVGSAISDIKKLRAVLANIRTPQVGSADACSHVKAVAFAWFQTYKPALSAAGAFDTGVMDGIYQQLLILAEKKPSTGKLRDLTKDLLSHLVKLQSSFLAAPVLPTHTSDAPPSFSAVPDLVMRQVLTRRWNECATCLAAGAPLAATVMMGGLLESLFLARVNREPNKQAVFTASAAPKDSKTQQPLTLRDWGLRDYIAVAHELKWIPQSVRDVSQVVRDYRNYIHPQKELSHQVALTIDDARMFWHVSKAIALHLL
jgi:hypothetical protein